MRDIEEYPAAVGDFDTAIYHLGNGLTHLRIYEMAWHHPGIIILHDFNIHPFFCHGFLGTEREILYEVALKEYGAEGEAAWAYYRKTKQFPDVWKFPMTHAIARRSRATVVHSRWVAERLGESTRIYCVHLGGEPQEWVDPETMHALKRKLCLDTACFWMEYLVC